MSLDPNREIETAEAGRKGGAVAAPYPGYAPAAGYLTAAEAGEITYLGMSRATWGSIWAGFFIGTMTYLLLASLGLALGISWVSDDRVARGTLQTAAAIWTILASLVALFIAGFVTSRMAALPGRATGALNGFLCGCVTLILLSVLALSPMMENLPTVLSFFMTRGTQQAGARIDVAQAAAWWSFIGLVLALGAAALGGWVGARPVAVEPVARGQSEVHRQRAPGV